MIKVIISRLETMLKLFIAKVMFSNNFAPLVVTGHYQCEQSWAVGEKLPTLHFFFRLPLTPHFILLLNYTLRLFFTDFKTFIVIYIVFCMYCINVHYNCPLLWYSFNMLYTKQFKKPPGAAFGFEATPI
jgi:hypothetical protein